jgi:hypothetical protein
MGATERIARELIKRVQAMFEDRERRIHERLDNLGMLVAEHEKLIETVHDGSFGVAHNHAVAIRELRARVNALENPPDAEDGAPEGAWPHGSTRVADPTTASLDTANGLRAQLRVVADERDKLRTQIDGERAMRARLQEQLENKRTLAQDRAARATELAAEVRNLREQAQRRHGLDARRLAKLAELEGREVQAAELVTAAQTFEKSAAGWRLIPPAVSAFLETVRAYNRKVRGEPKPDDCQAGTCDCPPRPGTADPVHRSPS